MSTKLYKIEVSTRSNPYLAVSSFTRNYIGRIRRLKQNIRSHQGTIGDWANFKRFEVFKDTPLEELVFTVTQANINPIVHQE